MNATLLRSWWLLAARGAIAILFGAAAILWPAITLITLAALFATFALLAGTLWMAGAQQRAGGRGLNLGGWCQRPAGTVNPGCAGETSSALP